VKTYINETLEQLAEYTMHITVTY